MTRPTTDARIVTPIVAPLHAKTGLATEILAAIFGFSRLLSLEEGRFHDLITTLAAVCSRWRRIIFTTQRLWTNIIICFNGRAEVHSKAGLLKLYLENSGALPLDVTLYFQNCKGDLNYLVHPSVDYLIWRNAQRITSFSLLTPPSLVSWTTLITHLSRLREFNLQAEGINSQEVLLFLNISSLSRVSLTSFSGNVILPLYHVTVLNLVNVPCNLCFHLLHQCTNLTSYYMRNPADLIDNDSWTPSDPALIMTRTNLKRFTWEFGHIYWDNLMLRHLRFPQLQSLTWVHFRDGLIPKSQRASTEKFCSHLSESLEQIEINGRIELFKLFPETHSELKQIAIGGNFWPGDLAHTVLKLNPSECTNGVTPFPKLTDLVIISQNSWITLSPEDCAVFLQNLLLRKTDETLYVTLYGISLDYPDQTFFYDGEMQMLREGNKVRLDFRGRLGEPDTRDTTPTWYQEFMKCV